MTRRRRRRNQQAVNTNVLFLSRSEVRPGGESSVIPTKTQRRRPRRPTKDAKAACTKTPTCRGAQKTHHSEGYNNAPTSTHTVDQIETHIKAGELQTGQRHSPSHRDRQEPSFNNNGHDEFTHKYCRTTRPSSNRASSKPANKARRCTATDRSQHASWENSETATTYRRPTEKLDH